MERYDRFGWDYEYLNPLTEKEISWYLGFAKNSGGPVLELACGTGRLLAALARAGCEIDGIDSSMAMLEIASERIAGLPAEMAFRVSLFNKDISDFAMDGKYSLIILADNSFSELITHEERLSCLRCVQKHLRPNGTFLLVARPHQPAEFTDNRKTLPWSQPVKNPVTGESVTRRGESEISEDGSMVITTFFYKTQHKDRTEFMEKITHRSAVLTKDDYLSLLLTAGFSCSVYGDYREEPDDGTSRILCFVCNQD